ncbi:MAG: DEAD/DEAH box helicase [Chitinophagia bacterium]|nr:DEAD/DEAH box helicase [Chitinophagia bacterium]
MSTFSDLNLTAPLLRALDEQGFTAPTTIQQKAFSIIMSGRDVCGIAQTGTGKTLAFLLPCIRMWKYTKDRFPRILVVVPTRELVTQVVEEARKLAVHTNMVVVGVYGGVNMKPQAKAIEEGCDMVVATPGRLIDLVYDASLRLKEINQLIIDEVDEMLNLGFRSQLNTLFGLLPERRQNLLFSATITEEVEALLHDNFNNPVRVEAAPPGTPLSNISKYAYPVPNFNTKVNLLEWLLANDEDMTRVMVFVATKALADDLYERLEARFPETAGVIHSNKEQNHRFNTVARFKEGVFRFIIATDLVARGLDIAEVTHVVNFDIPEVPENYIHRIGRTGRADKTGIAITFVTPKEQERLTAVEELMKVAVPVRDLPEGVYISDVLTKDEMPKGHLKEIRLALPLREGAGLAFEPKKVRRGSGNTPPTGRKPIKKGGKPGRKKR